jgi:hypothetical protein
VPRVLLVATIFSLALARESGAQSQRAQVIQVAYYATPRVRSAQPAYRDDYDSEIPGSARASTWMVAMRGDFTHAIPAGL